MRMKTFSINTIAIILLTTLFFHRANGQIDTLEYKLNLTVKKHAINGKKVDKKTYDRASKVIDSLERIRWNSTFKNPVWIRRYHNNGKISEEALECGECAVSIGDVPIGLYIKYDTSGRMVLKRNYVLITDKKEIRQRKRSGIPSWCIEPAESSQYYYDDNGQLIKILHQIKDGEGCYEYYKDGKLVNTDCDEKYDYWRKKQR